MEGKGSITIIIDAVGQQERPRSACLAWSNAATNHALPARMLSTGDGVLVEWIITEESAADFPTM